MMWTFAFKKWVLKRFRANSTIVLKLGLSDFKPFKLIVKPGIKTIVPFALNHSKPIFIYIFY